MKMLREPEVLARMGLGKTKFKTDYIDSGRARWIYGARVKRMPEHEVDRLIAEDIAAANAAAPAPRKPAVPIEACRKGAQVAHGRTKAVREVAPTSVPTRRRGCASRS